MNLRLEYFAQFREQAGTGGEEVDTDATDLTSLYASLAERHGFDLERTHVRVAVNHAIAAWSAPIQENDIITFLPPVAGG